MKMLWNGNECGKNNENLKAANHHKIKLKIKNLGKATTSCYGIKRKD
jgi:hypothetical protein